MNCPEHLIVDWRYVQIWHHQIADVNRRYVSWGEVMNPLRYEVCVGSGPGSYWHINEDAALNRRIRSVTWALWGRRRFERRLQQRERSD